MLIDAVAHQKLSSNYKWLMSLDQIVQIVKSRATVEISMWCNGQTGTTRTRKAGLDVTARIALLMCIKAHWVVIHLYAAMSVSLGRKAIDGTL